MRLFSLGFAIPILAVLTLITAGCRSPRPSGLDQWNACSLSGHTLTKKGPTKDGLEIESGGDKVLHLHAEWGRSSFASEYTFGNLSLVLPADVKPGRTLESPKGDYREGGQALVFHSTQLTGSVFVVDETASRIKLRLDLVAEKPLVDLLNTGKMEIKGEVTAIKRSSSKDCF